MINHQKLHRGLEILARAKRLTRQKDDQLRKRGQQAVASWSRIVVSQSALAKLIQLGMGANLQGRGRENLGVVKVLIFTAINVNSSKNVVGIWKLSSAHQK